MTVGFVPARSFRFPWVALAIGLCSASITTGRAAAEFPLLISESGRHFVDQKKDPFLWVGDSPWGLFLQSDAVLKRYMEDRARRGFTVLQAQILPEEGIGRFAKGLEPFGIPGDFGTPNDRYFDRVAGIVRYAGSQGMLVAINPFWLGCCEGGWRDVVKTNGPAKCLEYGRYLGRKFKRLENILWLHGGDTDPRPWLVEVRSIADGIREAAPTHRLHAVHCGSSSAGRELLATERWLTVKYACSDAVVVEAATQRKQVQVYRDAKIDYETKPTLPFVFGNAGYGAGFGSERGPAAEVLRRDAWWAMLSGAAGYTMGDSALYSFGKGWESTLDSPLSQSISHLGNLLRSARWQRLAPDFDHAWVPGGSGELNGATNPGGAEYVAVAADPEGAMLLAYLPNPRPVTVDLSKFGLPVLAKWFDPANGVFRDVDGSKPELPNAGKHEFVPPSRNSGGDGDWVLVIDGRPNRRPVSK